MDLEEEIYMYLLVHQKVRFGDLCDFVHDKLPEKQREGSFSQYGPTYATMNKLKKDNKVMEVIENGAMYVMLK